MGMQILKLVSDIRVQVKNKGDYRTVAQESGVGYEWLAKFAVGAIKNPTIDNVSKLERYFESASNDKSLSG